MSVMGRQGRHTDLYSLGILVFVALSSEGVNIYGDYNCIASGTDLLGLVEKAEQEQAAAAAAAGLGLGADVIDQDLGWDCDGVERIEEALQQRVRENEALPATDGGRMGPQQVQAMETLFEDAAIAHELDSFRRRVLLALQPPKVRAVWAAPLTPVRVFSAMQSGGFDEPLLPQQRRLFNGFMHECWRGNRASELAARRLVAISLGCIASVCRPASLDCLDAIVQLLQAVRASPAVPRDQLLLLRGLFGRMEAALQQEVAVGANAATRIRSLMLEKQREEKEKAVARQRQQ